jgi:hypothetical protein
VAESEMATAEVERECFVSVPTSRHMQTPNEFPIFHSFLQLSNQIKLAQYEKGTSRVPKKNSKLCMVIEYSKRNN